MNRLENWIVSNEGEVKSFVCREFEGVERGRKVGIEMAGNL